MVVDDFVMNAEQARVYTFDRVFHIDDSIRREQIDNINSVVVHHAYKSKECEEVWKRIGAPYQKYYPLKSTEPHYFDYGTGILRIINSRGVTRLIRNRDLTRVLQESLGRDISFYVDNYDENSAAASKKFEDFAYELVEDVFDHIDKESLQQGKLSVMMGPHNSLPDTKIIASDKNDYLNFKILQIEQKQVVAFDYIFADQAKNVLGQLYSTLNAYFNDCDVDLYHYGKVGILNNNLEVGDICVPIASLDENKVHASDIRPSPIHNSLVYDEDISNKFKSFIGEDFAKGTTVNTISVLRQTHTMLRKDLEAGGDFLDMEWSVMAGLDHGYNSCYPDLGKIKYYFAGVGSDKPLAGQTLGDTEYPDEKEKKVAQAFVRLISSK